MSVIIEATFLKSIKNTQNYRIIFTKGAPEVLQNLFEVLPTNYESTYLFHTKSGKRVLALGYKLLENSINNTSNQILSRNIVESKLHFLGFLVFNSTLKPETKSVIKELKNLSKPIMIITGDNVYTAADVARKLSIISKEKLLLVLEEKIFNNQNNQNKLQVVWKVSSINKDVNNQDNQDNQNNTTIEFDQDNLIELSKKYSLCLTGQSMILLEKFYQDNYHSIDLYQKLLQQLCPLITIFSRVSPIQKETITKSLNNVGLYTLYCGDGTNDCGKILFNIFKINNK